MKKIIVRILIGIASIILFLFLIVFTVLKFSSVQTYITHKITSSISNKTHTAVTLEKVDIRFPKSVVLKKIYLEDQKKDTLFYADEIAVDVDMFALFSKTIELNSVDLAGITAHISRSETDSSFNFDFITKSSSGDKKSPEPAKTDTTNEAWKFNLESLSLKNIFLTYDDSVSGNNIKAGIGGFAVNLKRFDLDQNIYVIGKVKLEKTVVSFLQSKRSEKQDTSSSPMPDISFDKINISNVKFTFENKISGQEMAYEIKDALIDADKIDLPNQIIRLNEINISGSKAFMALNKIDKPVNKITEAIDSTKAPSTTEKNWEVTVKNLKLNDNLFKSDDFNSVSLKEGMDYKHLFFSEINMDVRNLFYSSLKTSADIKNISVKEQCGFQLEKFTTHLMYDTSQAELASLDLQTNGSRIGDYLKISHSSLKNISASPGNAFLNVQLTNSKIQLKDILYFQPTFAVQPLFTGNENGIIQVNTKISGQLKDLKIENFIFSTAENTSVNMNGTIKNLPDAQNAFYDLTLTKLTTGKSDLNLLLKSIIPPTINFPTQISMSGFFKGTMKKFDSKIAFGSPAGGMFALVKMDEDKNKQPEYSANFKVMNLDLGYVLKDTSKTLGRLTLEGDVKGTGLKKENINADINLKLDSAQIKNYTYHDFVLQGNYAQECFNGNAMMQDSNLAFTFDGGINMAKGNQSYTFVFDLKGADLRALHFQNEDFRVSGKIEADLRGSDLNSINGNASVKDVLIIKNEKSYPIESLLFASINEKRKSNLSIESSVINVKFDGTIAPGEIGKEINGFINNYFAMQEKKPSEEPKVEQKFTFEADIRNSPVINEVFLPQLTLYSPGPIRGSYDSEKKNMELDINFPQIIYAGNKIDSLVVKIHSDAAKIYYQINFNELSGGSVKLGNTGLSGNVEKNEINIILDVKGKYQVQKLLMAGKMKSGHDKFIFSFTDQIIINGLSWHIPENNYLEFGNKFLYVHNMNLESNAQLISINSRENKNDSPLDLKFKNFELASLSQIVEQDSALLRGKLDGNVLLQNIFSNMNFTSDLLISNLGYKEQIVGDISLKATNTKDNRIDLNLTISGNENNIRLFGFYTPRDTTNNLNMDIDLASLNPASIQSFTNGQVTRASGKITGQFKINGTTANPKINGEINFKDVSFHDAYINNYLTLKDEKIKIDPSGIYFSSFVIRDSLNHEAVLSGDINTQNKQNVKFNLVFTTENFQALNTTQKDNELFFGNIILDSRIKVTGNQALPVIDVKAKVRDGSEFTISIPKERYTTDKGKGVVEFNDTTNHLSPLMTEKEKVISKPSEIKGLDVTTQLEINKNSSLKILIDPATGDSLFVRGDATLSFTIDPSGKMSLTGSYSISEGRYRVSLNELVRKSFEISPGSTINWNGDIMDAEVNIDAIYRIKTSPVDLVANEIAGLSEQEKNTYRQKLPFEVILHMKGALLKPDISFEIELPEEDRGALGGTVYAKLNLINQDESQLNKQVFALLVLNRFIQEDPLASSGGGNATENVARESVSKILSQQLNKFSNQLITGVELNFDVQSYQDYSTGQEQGRTQVNVGVKKQLLNERLSVQVGGSVDLEGQRAQQNRASDLAGDVTLEYKLTDDGRYRIKAFRQNQYENVFEGDVVETGAGIVYLRDYNKWKELFSKPKKEND